MTPSRPIRLRRRGVLGISALLAAAMTLVVRPTSASAAAKPECLADLLEQS
jgi:hypothetical protein